MVRDWTRCLCLPLPSLQHCSGHAKACTHSATAILLGLPVQQKDYLLAVGRIKDILTVRKLKSQLKLRREGGKALASRVRPLARSQPVPGVSE